MDDKGASGRRGMWQAYYSKWHEVTREKLDPALIELMPSLKRFVPPAAVMDKAVYSAFAQGDLGARLQTGHADTLIITGSETDVCVLASVLGAVDRGYRVIVARNAFRISRARTKALSGAAAGSSNVSETVSNSEIPYTAPC